MFGRFGTVVDLRIHSKPGAKMPGIRAPQNYGFITYEDPESVQTCLANMVSFEGFGWNFEHAPNVPKIFKLYCVILFSFLSPLFVTFAMQLLSPASVLSRWFD